MNNKQQTKTWYITVGMFLQMIHQGWSKITYLFDGYTFRLNFISIDTDKHKCQRNRKQFSEVASQSQKEKMNSEF